LLFVSAAIKIVKSDTIVKNCTFKDMYSGMRGAVFELENTHTFMAENIDAYNITSIDTVKIIKNIIYLLFNINTL